jgi:hypothetical protein
MDKDKNKKAEVNDNKAQKASNSRLNNNGKKDTLTNKNDVDEFDISDEYFIRSKREADGEDF